MNNGSLPISESFLSIQGEGKLTGVPSFFIRISGCNLRCTWCDTPYASWKPEGTPRTVGELAKEAAGSGVHHVVLTGGEPMLFDAIEPLSRELGAAGLHVTIETAATIFRPPDRLHCDLMSLSPKLSNSTPGEEHGLEVLRPGGWRERHERTRADLAPLVALLGAYPTRQLKFVVSSQRDLGEIEALLAQLPPVEPSDVLLMPEGVAPPSHEQRAWVAAACIERGWRYCARLHIELYGNTRGT